MCLMENIEMFDNLHVEWWMKCLKSILCKQQLKHNPLIL